MIGQAMVLGGVAWNESFIEQRVFCLGFSVETSRGIKEQSRPQGEMAVLKRINQNYIP
jgi:hypothetical protein